MFFSSDLAKNVLTLMTGTTVSQAIPLALTPVLTRLYTPEDFGVLALFLAIVAVLGSITNAKYELAIMLPETNKEALNIVYLSIVIAFFFSVVLFSVVVVFGDFVIGMLGEPRIGPWLYFIPVTVFLFGLYNALLIYNNRLKSYRDISVSNISKAVAQSTAQVAFGVLTTGAAGLIGGQFVSYFAGNWILLKNTFADSKLMDTLDSKMMRAVAKRYMKFPLLTLPGNFLNVMTSNVINILVANFYSLATLGYFSLARRMLGIPTSILGSSLGSVYFQAITQKKNEGGDVLRVFNKTVLQLMLCSAPIFIFLYYTVEPVLIFVLGKQWEMAGVYAKIMVPMAGVRFVSSAISATFNVFEKQQYIILVNFLLLSATVVVFAIGHQADISFELLFRYYVVIASMIYTVTIALYWWVTRQYSMLS